MPERAAPSAYVCRRRRRRRARVTHALRLDRKIMSLTRQHGLVASPSGRQESPRRHNRWMTGVHPLAHARLGPPRCSELTGVFTRNDHRSLYRDTDARCRGTTKPVGPWRLWPTLSFIGDTPMNGEYILIAVIVRSVSAPTKTVLDVVCQDDVYVHSRRDRYGIHQPSGS